jgi:hypothetical protein
MERAAAAAEVPGTAWMLLLPAYTFEPEALTTARLRVRVPYNAPVVYDRLRPGRAAGCSIGCRGRLSPVRARAGGPARSWTQAIRRWPA